MSTDEQFFLSFIDEINPVAAQNAKKMEELLFEDASSSIVKGRLFAEAVLNEVFKIEEIEAPYVNSLYDKISYLTRGGYIEREVQQSFDTIRLSGNKAAHDGGFNDITVAFKLHKEMYNIAVWFVEVYSVKQIKIPLYETPKPPKKEANIEDLVQKKIMQLLGSNGFPKLVPGEEQEEKQPTTPFSVKENSLFDEKIGEGESYLLRKLKRLQDSSQEAIENANQFSRFKNYMHVDRKIQLDFEHILEGRNGLSNGNLILLCGSVGDGKSHLLAYLKENKPHLIDAYTIYNDATESFSPGKNAMETLEEVLKSFSDQYIEDTSEKVILAINMGVLHNFIHTKHNEYSYQKLRDLVEESELFSPNITTHYSSGNFDLLSFGDYHPYELTKDGPTSSFYFTLMEKIFSNHEENPFYRALVEDEKREFNTMAHENYRMLQNEFVQKQIVNLLIEAIVKYKLVISARAFLNFIADIIIPDDVRTTAIMSEFEVLKNAVPTLLFNRKERSVILKALSYGDPIHKRSIYIDQIVIDLNTLSDWGNLIEDNIVSETAAKWLKPLAQETNLTNYSFDLFFKTFIRIASLTNKQFAAKLTDPMYTSFMKYLYYFNVGEKAQIINFYGEIKSAIFNWKGSPKREYIYLNKPDEKFRIAQKLVLRPTVTHIKQSTEDVLYSFKSSILMGYHKGDHETKEFLDIDFPLYELMMKVEDGYRPNKKDIEDAIKFVEFIEKLMVFGEKRNELLIHYPNDKKFYKIKKDDFERFVFEREK
ncbi:DNA phosphorothioation-dependent restriction protein DptF [Rossellomorea sp. YZS02]|uniref:DNA phosphorothioation-dependent restriction protein DptF n=1 Tax=Rossellomorea sp. YZS02 TaxID=3097358 RepID=UPI002A0BF093|nr:DNA phosphorothioation-dependent restriction protein DptF [Rossellomorea sp. YZS02]MDX8344496.1 DNA phosphorothioation-dependent restriction protein DptF [Rossellomorea sp. YZS02]